MLSEQSPCGCHSLVESANPCLALAPRECKARSGRLLDRGTRPAYAVATSGKRPWARRRCSLRAVLGYPFASLTPTRRRPTLRAPRGCDGVLAGEARERSPANYFSAGPGSGSRTRLWRFTWRGLGPTSPVPIGTACVPFASCHRPDDEDNMDMYQGGMSMNDTHISSAPAALTEGHAICGCGQELDACRRDHCPRCGHRIEHGVLAGAVV